MQDTQQTLQRLAEAVGPAVVGLGRGWGVGSGIVVEGGRVVTNAPVSYTHLTLPTN